jgi:hypothetical protein
MRGAGFLSLVRVFVLCVFCARAHGCVHAECVMFSISARVRSCACVCVCVGMQKKQQKCLGLEPNVYVSPK